MRVPALLCTAALLTTVVAMTAGSRVAPEDATTNQIGAPPRVASRWIKLTFGLDAKSVSWDGKVVGEGGRILRSAPWSFEKRDRFDPNAHAWFCTSVVVSGRSQSSFAEPARGVLVELDGPEQAQLKVTTRQGNFTVDPGNLKAGTPQTFLDGRASAELLGAGRPLPDRTIDSTARTEDDFPSLAITPDGHRWIAWIAYEDDAKRDHLRVLDLDDPDAKVEEIATAREQVDPQLIAQADGGLFLCWAAPVDGDWEIHASRRTKSGWSAAERLTVSSGSDFHLRAAQAADGAIWLTWQGFRGDNSNIFVKRLKGERWSKTVPVADSPANEWEPAISVDAQGRAWIGYDSYENGNYDVFVRNLAFDANGRAERGPAIAVAASEEFEAHASVEAGDDGTVWVAYDIAGPNWGKCFTRDETTFRGQYAETLHGSRRLGLRAIVDGRLHEPTNPLPQKITRLRPTKILHSDTDEYRRFHELPQLVRDADNRLWVFFRLNRQGYAGHPKMGANWEFYATTLADGEWIEPILLPLSKGRQSQRVTTAIDGGGRIHAAWSTGDHHVDLANQIQVGHMPQLGSPPETPTLEAIELKPAAKTTEPVVRSWKVQQGADAYQVYFGDLHRHTDISLCFPTADGCLVDTYRYALDAARLDFIAITDHTRDTDPFPWWRTQKANDLFHVREHFAPIYGYERSNGVAGGGHRNVFFLDRDWPVLRGDAHYSGARDQRPKNNNPDVALYPKLRGRRAFTAAHTPGYSAQAKRGTWTYHDPQVEPLAEIVQTFRHDYERPGAPQWRDARDKSQVREEASLWYALARGHKLGFIASSDHHATHTSYACVWAADASREEIFDGLRSRRTYAATDKIILDVRMNGQLMGSEIAAPAVPTLQIHVRGTDTIEEIQVVRNRTVISTSAPNRREVEMTFADSDYPGGAAYYYVRIRQRDNNMAWGSPIWIK